MTHTCSSRSDAATLTAFQTDEKYISFSRDVLMGYKKDEKGNKCIIKRHLWSVDSFKFMSSSLVSLLKNVKSHPISVTSALHVGVTAEKCR